MSFSTPDPVPHDSREVLPDDPLRKTTPRPPRLTLRQKLKRLAVRAGLVLVVIYLLGAITGFVWLRVIREIPGVGFFDVALLQRSAVRRALAEQHFANARNECSIRDFPAAYLSYTSGVRNDPDNIPGRLAAADFFLAMGAAGQAATLLEQGLVRAPDDSRLIDRTFGVLLSSGRAQAALDLLHERYGTKFGGPDGPRLLAYELYATLRTQGATAAARLLALHPALRESPVAAPAVAQVLWETGEPAEAVRRLATHVQAGSGDYASYAQLVGWQLSLGRAGEAQQAAAAAVARFPREMEARLLQIEALAAAADFRQCRPQIEAYLREFGARPNGLVRFARLCGARGWLDMSYALYELGAVRHGELGRLALYYGDALAANVRYEQAARVFAQLEAQTADSDLAFLLELNQRQVMTAAALGDHDAARDFARRVALTLRDNPRGREQVRRHFSALGIAEAAAELAEPVEKAAKAPGGNAPGDRSSATTAPSGAERIGGTPVRP